MSDVIVEAQIRCTVKILEAIETAVVHSMPGVFDVQTIQHRVDNAVRIFCGMHFTNR